MTRRLLIGLVPKVHRKQGQQAMERATTGQGIEPRMFRVMRPVARPDVGLTTRKSTPSTSPRRPRWHLGLAFAAMASASFVAWSQAGEPMAMLRIACDGPSANADVSINGVFKGQCPVDVPVAGGTVRVRVSKRVDAEREQVFESELQLVGGTAKRVDVELGPVQLNERTRNAQAAVAAQREAEALRLAQAQAAQAAQARDAAMRAVVEAQAKAQAGDVTSMLALARSYDQGVGAAKNIETAFAWYLKAAQGGSAEAMFRVGRRYNFGHGVAKDTAQAVAWYRKSAEAGHVNAMGGLATAYLEGLEGVPANVAQAAVWAQRGLEKGLYVTDGRAAYVMSVLHGRGEAGLPVDKAKANEWTLKAAAMGARTARVRVAASNHCQSNLPAGEEVHRAQLRALSEPGDDGEPGSKDAMFSLGEAYETGCQGLTPDHSVARQWFEAAAAAGSARAMQSLAKQRWAGRGGLPKSEEAALALFRQSAAAGSTEAMINVGWFYEKGLAGLPADKGQAASWYRRAKAQGNPEGHSRLGQLGIAYLLGLP